MSGRSRARVLSYHSGGVTTTASTKQAETQVHHRRWLWSVLPRFEEKLTPELWRFSGKLRFWAVLILSLQSLLVLAQHESMHLDPDTYWTLFAFEMPIQVIDFMIGFAIWKGNLSNRTCRRLTWACIVMEAFLTVATAYCYGTVSSHMAAVAMVLVFLYRLSYDFRIGLGTLVLLLVGHWAVAIGEVSGWIPSQPMSAEGIDFVYRTDAREINAMILYSLALTLGFAMANWAVARMRFKEVTIRLLREQLNAAEAIRVGKHSGKTLADTYVVGGLVDAGGMGEIYAGEHRRTRRKVALKMLHAHLADDEHILARFKREAEAIGRLGSEHIVEVLDVGAEDGQPFLVLELLDGENLGARLAKGPLDLQTLDLVVQQIALGLDAAHKAGVVHRDLKPDNVYLSRRDDGTLLVKILDFGVSKVRDKATAITREVALLGTPDYMSPEQAVGLTEEVGERSDIFSLGGIVYAALTGRPPFVASSMPAQLRRICDEEPVPLAELRPDVPPAVAAVVAIAMAKRPEQRYARATELALDLSAAIADALPEAVLARAAAIDRGKPATRPTTTPRASDALANAQTQGG